MADSKNPGDKTLSVGPTKTLTLKRGVGQGTVRQSFSHGRTKEVVVEKVKRRGVGGDKPEAPVVEKAPAPAPAATVKASAPAKPAAAPQAAPKPPRQSGVVLRTLTEEERNARTAALADARVREVEERKIAEEEARRRAEREAIERADREAAEARKRDEESRRKHDEETKQKAEQEAKKRFGTDDSRTATTPATPRPAGHHPGHGPRAAVAESDDDDAPRTVRRGAGGVARPVAPPKAAPAKPGMEKRRGRLTLVNAFTADEERIRIVMTVLTQIVGGRRGVVSRVLRVFCTAGHLKTL